MTFDSIPTTQNKDFFININKIIVDRFVKMQIVIIERSMIHNIYDFLDHTIFVKLLAKAKKLTL